MEPTQEKRRWSKKYPDLGTGPVPAESCISPEYFELERERVFERTWLNVGRIEQVATPGAYFVREIAVCRASILIVRGKDGVIRGFQNVCSHRSNQLVWDTEGQCRGAFACKFHGWAYDTEGALVGIFDEDSFFDLDKESLGLTPVATDVWEGFIFVHLDPNPTQGLVEFLGGVADQLGGGNFGDRPELFRYEIDERANWKVALDAQNEAYHLPIQHRYSFPNVFSLEEERFLRLANVELYEHHGVWSTRYGESDASTPAGLALAPFDTGSTGKRLPMIGDFDFFQIFPNFAILQFRGPSDDWYVTYNIWPLAVDRCIWEIRVYFPPAENAGQRLVYEYQKHRLIDALQEDALAHETLQRGLASRAKSHLLFQDDEIQIRHFHRVLENHMEYFGRP